MVTSTSLSRTLLPIIVKYSKYFYSLELKEVFGAVKNGDINTINNLELKEVFGAVKNGDINTINNLELKEVFGAVKNGDINTINNLELKEVFGAVKNGDINTINNFNAKMMCNFVIKWLPTTTKENNSGYEYSAIGVEP
ncbi:proline--tRNA ligase-like [Dysidea avara]|uniref:proline--tRNA ligase-like n=1 Tax=Dysidea avara TaxID=196820 RepID=UPI00331FFCDD